MELISEIMETKFYNLMKIGYVFLHAKQIDVDKSG